MRIVDAKVVDPTLSGVMKRPYLSVVVDEEPDETIAPESFAGGWTVAKYGPFVKYEIQPENSSRKRHDYLHESIAGLASEFNLRFRNKFPVVVDIDLVVKSPGEPDEHVPGMSLSLSRARQLVRKYDRDWSLYLVDKDATELIMSWTPVNKSSGCRWWLGTVTCGDRPSRPIRIDGVDLPVCNYHLDEFKRNKAEEDRLAKA